MNPSNHTAASHSAAAQPAQGERPVRTGVVGYGWWGKTIARQIAGSPWLELAAVSETHEPTRALMADDPVLAGVAVIDCAQALLRQEGLEAVILCTPHEQHAGQIVAAAQAGLHVFCEKPLCLTLEDARRAVAACAAHGRVLGIGHERRFEPEVAALRRMIDDGVLGTVLQIEANFSQDKFFALPKDNWRLSNRHATESRMTSQHIPTVQYEMATSIPIPHTAAGTHISCHTQIGTRVTSNLCRSLTTSANRPVVMKLWMTKNQHTCDTHRHTHTRFSSNNGHSTK